MYAELSRRASNALDAFGYGTHQRQFRRTAYNSMDNGKAYQKFLYPLKCITVGSKGEGLTNVFESDRDMLFINTKTVCTERGFEGLANNDQTVLTCVPDISYPGHLILQLYRMGPEVLNSIAVSFRSFGTNQYLSSSDFLKYKLGDSQRAEPMNGIKTHGIAGPSVSVSNGGVSADCVYVLPCFVPSILNAWGTRVRVHNWPSPELVAQVIRAGAVAAPTAHSESPCKHLEWRICFNIGETLLVTSLNDTQCKLYVLLKMVKTDVLKPKKKEVTSYVLKNIVFWLAESNRQELFTEDTLYFWLVRALEFLRSAIKQQNLPYYMIPARNLLAGKMFPEQKEYMLDRLEQVLASGPDMLLMCGKLNRALTAASPEKLQLFGNKRNQLEKYMLVLMALTGDIKRPGLTMEDLKRFVANDVDALTCLFGWSNIVLPGWFVLAFAGVDVATIVKERLKLLLV